MKEEKMNSTPLQGPSQLYFHKLKGYNYGSKVVKFNLYIIMAQRWSNSICK